MVPNGWEKHPVGKLCKSIVPGRNKPKVFDGDIPWVTTPEILGKYIPSKIQKNFISQYVAKECGAKIVPKGAVVIAAVGELGLTAIATEEIILNQQLHAFVCPNDLDNEYLAYFLSTQKPYMDTVASKTTIPYMNKTNCESIPILLPPLPEQQKIAKILSTWDKSIATTEKLIATSQQQKKALMQQLLTGKKRLVNPDTGKVFEGDWLIKPLKNIAKLQAGKFVKASEIYDIQNETLFPCYGGNGLRGFTASYTHEGLYSLIGRQGALCGNITLAIGKFHATEHAVVVTPFQDVDTKWLYYKLIELNLNQYATGQAQPGLSVKNLDPIDVLVAPVKEQQKIASVLTAADKEIELLQAKLAHLKDEKKALMQQLLTGKRRVKVEAMEMA